jgi:hypothetical protein
MDIGLDMALVNRSFVFILFLIAFTWSFSCFGVSQAENTCKQELFKHVKGMQFLSIPCQTIETSLPFSFSA